MQDDHTEAEPTLSETIAAMRAATPGPTVEPNSQEWAGMDGTTAYLLIKRHADNWADVGMMMGEWLEANRATQASAPAPQALEVSSVGSAASSGGSAPADPHDSPTVEQLIAALAECRNALPNPPVGDALQGHWAAAMSDPLLVPGYVKACAAHLRAPAAEPAAWANIDALTARALDAPGLTRLREWAETGPVQRADVRQLASEVLRLATAAGDKPSPVETAARIAVDAWQSGHMLAEAMDALMDHLGMPESEAAGAAPPAQQWVSVPVEPTPAMLAAVRWDTDAFGGRSAWPSDIWRDMLAAAPQHQGGGK